MKDRARDRFPSYCPMSYRTWLKARKIYRQTFTRIQERKASRQPLDPLLEDGPMVAPSLFETPELNPVNAINKCARWLEEDLRRDDIKAITDPLGALKAELTQKRLRFTNTAGNFLAREYHTGSERGKLWEDSWVIRHADINPGYKVLDVGGASTAFSFYLASLGCHVVIVDNDWANCGTLFNADYVAKRMRWRLQALDHDVQKPLPFPDDYFDRVFSICVLEHLPCRIRQFLMKEIGRVLKPGGIAGFTVDYDSRRPVLLTDKGLRFGYRDKLERDVIRPSGLAVYGSSYWADACPPEIFLGALFLQKAV